MLRRQAVLDALPRSFPVQDVQHLLSSPVSNRLFDPVMVAKVQDKEQAFAQQRMIASVVQGLATSVKASAAFPCGSGGQGQSRGRPGVTASSPASTLAPPLQRGPIRPGVPAVEFSVAGVSLAREVGSSPVPVGACLQRHWGAWGAIDAGEWVVKTLRYDYVLPFLRPLPLSGRPVVFHGYEEGSEPHVCVWV